jgi:hypothetical protein
MARSIIQDLITEGACVLYSDYRSGSVWDFAKGYWHVSTMTDCHFNGAGVQFLSTGKISITDNIHTLELTTGTIVVLGKFDNVDSGTMVHKEDGGGRNYKFGFTSSTELFFRGSAADIAALTISAGKSCHAVSFTSGSDPVGYTDGIYVGDYDNAITVATNDAPLLIGHEFESVEGIQGCTISAVIICNRVLTATEHAQVYGELSGKIFPKNVECKSSASLSFCTDDTNCLASWDMVPRNNKIQDKTKYHNDLILPTSSFYSKEQIGNACYVNANSKGAYTSTNMNFQTLSCWFNFTYNAGYVYQVLMNKYLSLSDEWGIWIYTLSGISYIVIYDDIDNVNLKRYATTIKEKTWYHVVATIDNSTFENKLYLNGVLVGSGSSSTANTSSFTGTFHIGSLRSSDTSYSLDGYICNPKVYSDLKDQAWVTKEFNRGKNVAWQTNFGIRDEHQNVTDDIYPFSQIGGAHNIKSENLLTVAPDGSNILDNAVVKALWCQTPGYILISGDRLGQTPTECAYGTWDFWLCFSLDGTSTVSIHLFLDDAANGYRLHFDEMGICSLFRFDSGVDTSLFVSASPVAIDPNSWVHMIIKRDISGAFYIYSSNILYNGMTLLAAASGSNPVTDTTYTEAAYNYMIALTYDGASPLMNAISLGDSSGNYSLIKKILS